MKHILPDRETAKAKGWTHQVQWLEGDRLPCFIRCLSGEDADAEANRLARSGHTPIVIDLRDALQLH